MLIGTNNVVVHLRQDLLLPCPLCQSVFFGFLGLGFQFDQFLFWILFLGFLGLWKFEKGEWEKKRMRGRWGKNDFCLFCWRIRRGQSRSGSGTSTTLDTWKYLHRKCCTCKSSLKDSIFRWTLCEKSANLDLIRLWKLTLKNSIYSPKSNILDSKC